MGFIELKNLILDTTNSLPLRKDILKIYLLTCDFDNGCVPLFNGGKTFAIANIDLFRNVFIQTCGGTLEEWDTILVKYKIRCIHTYREVKANRHGHHNMKPSFWALGYMTLAAFAKDHKWNIVKFITIAVLIHNIGLIYISASFIYLHF